MTDINRIIANHPDILAISVRNGEESVGKEELFALLQSAHRLTKIATGMSDDLRVSLETGVTILVSRMPQIDDTPGETVAVAYMTGSSIAKSIRRIVHRHITKKVSRSI